MSSATIILSISIILGSCNTSPKDQGSSGHATSKVSSDLSTVEGANTKIRSMLAANDKVGMRHALSQRISTSFATQAEYESWFETWRTSIDPNDARKPFRLVQEGGEFKLDEK